MTADPVDQFSSAAGEAAAYDHAAELVAGLDRHSTQAGPPGREWVPLARVLDVARDLRERAIARRASAPRLRQAPPPAGRRFVVAEDPDGQLVAVGPVFVDEGEQRARDAVDAAGWQVSAVVAQLSVSEFRARHAAKTGGRR